MGSEFCALSTKLKAMHAGHLTSAEYSSLLEAKSVGEICSSLKETVYAPYISDLNEFDVHRGKLEERLDSRKRNEYLKLYVFVDLNQRKMIRFFFMRDEIEALKIVLRACYNHETSYLIHMDELKSDFFKKHSDINTELLIQSRTTESVAQACKGTVFYPVLRHAVSSGADYTTVCMMLDRLYFKNLWRDAQKYIPKAQKEDFKKYVGTQIDYLNIMWIYRCKKYFKMPNELIYTYLIPVYYRLSKEDISQMAEAPDTETIENTVAGGVYRKIFAKTDETFLIERVYKRIWYENAKKAYKLNPGTMTEVFAYFDLLIIEIENLETVIEGIRYKADTELIRKNIYTD